MFACAHDYRIMNSEKGFICLPEIDINMRLPEGMTSVCQVKVPPNAYRELMLGKRIPAQEGEKLQLIDKAVPKGDVLDSAFELARELAPKGVNKFVMGQIKYQAYKQSFEHCTSGNIDVNVPKLDWRARL